MEARLNKTKMDFKTTDGTISLVRSDGTVSTLRIPAYYHELIFYVFFSAWKPQEQK